MSDGEKPLRILHVASHAGVYRGGAVQLCRMATWQHAQGHHVTVVCNPAEHHAGRDFLAQRATWRANLPAGVRVVPLPVRTRFGPAMLSLAQYFLRPDVLHLHRDDAVDAARRLLRQKERRFAIVVQRGTTRPSRGAIQRMLAKGLADAVTCVADAVRAVQIEEGVPAELLHTVYGSVDHEAFSPGHPNEELRRTLGLAAEHYVFGSLSSYRKAKNLEGILTAFAAVHRERPQARLVMAGKNLEERLPPMASKLGIAEAVVFAGHQQDVPAWLRAMDCTLMAATTREGLSGVLRESLACAVPVISTDSDGNPEIVQDGRTGLLVPPGDNDALAAAMLRAVDDPEGMRQLAAAGRTWVLENCTLEAQGTRLLAIYQQALARRAR